MAKDAGGHGSEKGLRTYNTKDSITRRDAKATKAWDASIKSAEAKYGKNSIEAYYASGAAEKAKHQMAHGAFYTKTPSQKRATNATLRKIAASRKGR